MAKNKKGRGTVAIIVIIIAVVALLVGIRLYNEFDKSSYPLKYQDSVEKYSAEYGLDKYLVYAVIRTESGFDPGAVSAVGAQGLMQIMPESAEWIAGKLGRENYDMFDPDTNIEFGCWYLGFLSERFDNPESVIAAYNAGHGNVQKWLENPEYTPDGITLVYIPFDETRNYVEKVESAYKKYLKFYEEE